MKIRRESGSVDTSNNILSSLSKLGSLDTLQKGIDEIKGYLMQNKKSEERIMFFLNSLNPTNEHMLSQNHKKEFIKIYGIVAEILEGDCIPYLGRLISALLKKLKEANTNLNEAISQSYGIIIHNTLHTLSDLPTSCTQLSAILKPLFEYLTASNRVLQIGAGLCVTKIIQHSPIECLRFMLEKLSLQLIELLSTSKAQTQIIEALISLILSVEQEFANYTPHAVPELINCLSSDDFTCRKQVLDALYTLGAVVPGSIIPYAREILGILGKVRTDKIKPVRDSAVELINLFKKLAPEPVPKAQKHKIESPKEELKPKSIFKGPINANFFKAAKSLNDDSIVEIPTEKSIHQQEYNSPEVINNESPRSISPSFREPEASQIEKFEFEESVHEDKTSPLKIQQIAHTCNELSTEFRHFKEQTKNEFYQINQRLLDLEDMISTVSQLFDAKIKQLTNNPNIAALLRK